MIYEASPVAIGVFALFVGVTLAISFYLGGRAKSAQGYFAAHGQIPWFVNGVAFAGDYLSAASFLGICGMIAFYGYDGFLYSIGYLAGWVVALFVIAEPMKRLGKFTFADALDARFQSKGIKLAAGISTLAVSLFYLIPQMVGAGALVRPLFGLPAWAGVVMVGVTVILIVVTAGMVSTTWVQFIKGSLLVAFSFILTAMILARGFEVRPGGHDGHEFRHFGPYTNSQLESLKELPDLPGWKVVAPEGNWVSAPYIRLVDPKTQAVTVWHLRETDTGVFVDEAQSYNKDKPGGTLVNGLPMGTKPGEPELHPVGYIHSLPGGVQKTGPLSPVTFLSTLQESEVVLWSNKAIVEPDKSVTTVYSPRIVPGRQVLRPGEHPTFKGIRSQNPLDKVDFLSLMLALFCGTASLPHILIRYYTVKDESSARKSTIVGIASIGCFYVLTLYLGLGAMTSGLLDLTDTNMAAPLLAKGMNQWLFAAISAIAFTTVLGTVSGLILACAGAVTHDLATSVLGIQMNDSQKVRIAKLSSVVVGAVAICLGIAFEKMNVTYLVGWAFSVAASANLPSLVMLLFWPKTTRQGVIASVVVGMSSSLAWILLSADTIKNVYGLKDTPGIVPFSQPGIVTIPLAFATLVLVSLLTQPRVRENAAAAGR